MTELAIEAPPRVQDRRERWRWMALGGRPGWVRPLLLLVQATAAVAYAWGIDRAPLTSYYTAAAASMSTSWRAFAYGALDPAASITVDKLAGTFMVQALSVRVFGLDTWSLILPQVLAALAAVLVLYRMVRRWQGPAAGLLAAALLAATPIMAAMAHSQFPEPLLVLLVVLAADAWLLAVQRGRVGWLLLAGVWVGLAFQIKMVQGWVALAPLALGYLLAAPAGLGRRLGHLALAGLVTVGVSLWQVLLFWLTPGSRPYADGTVDDSLLSMIFVYNFSARIRLGSCSDAVVGYGSCGVPDDSAAAGTDWWYMLSDRVGSQVGWLYPLAVAGAVLGLVGWRSVRRGGPGRRDLARAVHLMWTVWLLLHVIVLTFAGEVGFLYHLMTAAPALSALAASGTVALWRLYRGGGWRAGLLPAVLAVSLVWAVHLAASFPGYLPWLGWAVAGVGAAAVVLLSVGALPAAAGRLTRLGTAGVVLGLAGVLLAPAAWSASTGDPPETMSPIMPAAGPPGFDQLGMTDDPGARPEPTPEARRVVSYLDEQYGGEPYLLAAQGSVAAPLIIAGAPVMQMGGFYGIIGSPTADELAAMVERGELRYVILGHGWVPLPTGTGVDAEIAGWVRGRCAPVVDDGIPVSLYDEPLYDCAPRSAG